MATVVIVGGGIAGSLLAKYLQDHCNVVLIDQKEYLEIVYAELRSMVEPSFANKSVISHFEYIPKVRLIVSTAVKVTETEVFTANGQCVSYDYLVIATGHVHTGELTKNDRLKHYETEHKRIKECNSVLIVGGGPTGVELAAEISTEYPEKNITLVTRGTRLLDFIGIKASKKTLKWLNSKNVQVILGQYVDFNPTSDGVYKTSGGETIKADGVFKCLGMPLGSKWLKETILASSLDDQARLMVDENLRIKGYKKIFAIGDITDIPEMKQGYLAHQHAAVAAKNLKLLISGAEERKLSTYKAAKPLALVALGRHEAVAQIKGITTIGKIPGKIKSGDLFVGRIRKDYGLKS